jgi:MoxR-like ATPase
MDDLETVKVDIAPAQSDAVTEYLKLDPQGSYFTDHNITWSTKFEQPVARVDICKLPFERLLGERHSVPKVDEGFFPLGNMVELFHSAESCDLNFAITGHAGTGKSMFIEQMAARLNRPFFVADFHEDYRAETLFGEYKPVDGGKLEFKKGPVTEASENEGSFMLMDEANMAPPAVLACLHRALTGSKIYLHDKAGTADEVAVTRQKGVVFTMACNALNSADDAIMYNDTKQMNRAFLDRWGVVCEATYPNKTSEVAILLKKTEIFSPSKYQTMLKEGFKRKVEQLVNVAAKIRTSIDAGDLDIAFSLRRTEAVCKLMAHHSGDITKPVHMGILTREDAETSKTLDALFFSEFKEVYKRKFKETKEDF